MDYFNYFDNFNDTYLDYDYNAVFTEVTPLFQPAVILSASYVIACIAVWIGFPLTMLAICALHSQIKEDKVAPVFVINLLLSELIQIGCLLVWVLKPDSYEAISISRLIYYFAVKASVGFMMCVALERFLVIAWPLRYRFKRSKKVFVWICAAVWVISLIEFPIASFLKFTS